MNRFLFYSLLAGILIYFTTAFFSVGYYHADEHFQLLEFASYKTGNPATPLVYMAWEYSARIRPSAQVLVAWSAIEAWKALGVDDPFIVAAFLRLLSAVLSMACLGILFLAFRQKYTSHFSQRLYLIFCISLWFLPYLSVRFSSETWSGDFFFLAVGWLLLLPSKRRSLQLLGIGLLLGTAFIIRYQTGFMTAGLLIWLIMRREYRRPPVLIPILSGIGIMALAGVVCDHWLYGEWTFSAWQYFKVNLLEGKAATFGTEPWWWYFPELVKRTAFLPGLAILCGLFYLWIKRTSHILSCISLPFILIHILIAHKELRFLFPLFCLLPWLLSYCLTEIRIKSVNGVVWKSLYLTINLPLLVYLMFSPADTTVKALQEIRKQSGGKPLLVYYTSVNPFSPFGLAYTFYQPDLKVKFRRIGKIKDLDSFRNIPTPKMLFLQQPAVYQPTLPGFSLQPVYHSIPKLVSDHFNFNHWIDRTSSTCLFLIKTEELKE